MGEKPRWKTESRYPLSDRLVQQAEELFGVRFGKQTCYCLLDIDITSAYHPHQDIFAISNLAAALEPLGLVSYVACTSSFSKGIHLYFPFQQAQNSWELALAVAALLEKAGFKLAPGQLEIFPNPRPYIAGSRPSLFHAHRLPMQVGSYLLDQVFQPIWSDRSIFAQQWQWVQNRNALDTQLLKQLGQTRQKLHQVSGKAEKFLADLNTEIASGWTGSGQTNHLLGRIALRTYVFHHILFGGEPLTGRRLVDQIVATARSLPGYSDWCQHQHEIEKRATEWARCVEGSHYFPYGSRRSTPDLIKSEPVKSISSTLPSDLPTWNQQQAENARERIRQAIVHLLETNTLPVATTARFQALTQFGIGGSSLYRHKDLWHPSHLTDHPVDHPVENPPDPPTSNDHQRSDSASSASDALNSTSLFPSTDRNALQRQAFTRSIEPVAATGCNALPSSSPLSSLSLLPSALCPLPSPSLPAAQRMQQFLNSGDPILVAEALSYFQAQPVKLRYSAAPFLTAPAVPASPDHGNSQFFMRQCFEVGRRSDLALSEEAGEDLSDLLATITIEIRRLGWAKEQVIGHLWQQFGKSHQSRLSNEELVKWLEWLKADKFPVDTG